MTRICLILFFVIFLANVAIAAKRTENVILVTIDGVRVEEVFRGLDAELFRSIDKNADKNTTFRKYYADSSEASRAKLMPFLWGELVPKLGSIAGNRANGSKMETTNNLLFSYPGYSEILTGEAHDEIINTNSRVQNRFPSVLQFLQKKLNLDKNKVAAFASWDVINEAASSDPNSFVVNAGYEEYPGAIPAIKYFSDTQFLTPTEWQNVRHDFYTYNIAFEHIKKYKPRVVFLSLGETDDWAHGEHYDKMLDALNRNDSQIRNLWRYLQSEDQYRDKTTMIITVDHGRGSSGKQWSDHGRDVPDARNIWAAFISPDFAPRGEWRDTKTIYQNQIAATLSKAMGFDFSEQNKNAGKPIDLLFAK